MVTGWGRTPGTPRPLELTAITRAWSRSPVVRFLMEKRFDMVTSWLATTQSDAAGERRLFYSKWYWLTHQTLLWLIHKSVKLKIPLKTSSILKEFRPRHKNQLHLWLKCSPKPSQDLPDSCICLPTNDTDSSQTGQWIRLLAGCQVADVKNICFSFSSTSSS